MADLELVSSSPGHRHMVKTVCRPYLPTHLLLKQWKHLQYVDWTLHSFLSIATSAIAGDTCTYDFPCSKISFAHQALRYAHEASRRPRYLLDNRIAIDFSKLSQLAESLRSTYEHAVKLAKNPDAVRTSQEKESKHGVYSDSRQPEPIFCYRPQIFHH